MSTIRRTHSKISASDDQIPSPLKLSDGGPDGTRTDTHYPRDGLLADVGIATVSVEMRTDHTSYAKSDVRQLGVERKHVCPFHT
jgi:hypothetical protein